MRKPVLLIFTNALILIVVFMLLAQSLFVVQRLAQAQDVRGFVEVQRQGHGDFQPLLPNATVAIGDVVRTGANGEVEFAWADHTRWRLMPRTTLTVQSAALNSVKHVEASRLRLDAGKVFVRMVKRLAPDSSFEVETPGANAAARGTVFSIAAANGETKVEVWKGSVDLTDNSGDKDTVKSGQQASAGKGNVMVSPAPDAGLPAEMRRPEIDVDVQQGKGNMAAVQGSTEASSHLLINEKIVPVLGNGIFFSPVKLAAGHNEWNIQVTDLYGATATQCLALEFDSATQKTRDSSCAVK